MNIKRINDWAKIVNIPDDIKDSDGGFKRRYLVSYYCRYSSGIQPAVENEIIEITFPTNDEPSKGETAVLLNLIIRKFNINEDGIFNLINFWEI